MRTSQGLLACTALVVSCAAGCAAAPSMVGFAHPDPAPPSGHELVVGVTGGGGAVGARGDEGGFAWFWDAGGGLSYAARIAEVGLSLSAWAVTWSAEAAVVGSQLEVAVPVGAYHGDAKAYLLGGVGVGSMISAENYRPQGSLGVLFAPPPGRSGNFGGLRLHGGVNFDAGSEPEDPAAAFSLTGAYGYRWASASRAVYPGLQLAPFVDYAAGAWGSVSFGAQLVFTLGFQLGA